MIRRVILKSFLLVFYSLAASTFFFFAYLWLVQEGAAKRASMPISASGGDIIVVQSEKPLLISLYTDEKSTSPTNLVLVDNKQVVLTTAPLINPNYYGVNGEVTSGRYRLEGPPVVLKVISPQEGYRVINLQEDRKLNEAKTGIKWFLFFVSILTASSLWWFTIWCYEYRKDQKRAS